MTISIFDLFSIGIGPSSSHTVGPMRAAKAFVDSIGNKLGQVAAITISLHGSLAYTGEGHGTNKAILLGLEGELPETVDPDFVHQRYNEIFQHRRLNLLQMHVIKFLSDQHLLYDKEQMLPHFSNGMRFTAVNQGNKTLKSEIYYSIGGGFILTQAQAEHPEQNNHDSPTQPFPFDTASELLAHCARKKSSIHDIILENESVWRDKKEIRKALLSIADVMFECIDRGCESKETTLMGGLNVLRRAPKLYEKLLQLGPPDRHHPQVMNWLNAFALAVNEENAAGGRVVTAPTNGAAGIIPAVLKYYKNFCAGANDDGICNFLLTAGAIGILYKKNAAISGAEMGCQGEVGVACSMAAGGLAAALGGDVAQVENAAEVGMEHNLGLTCDPVAGLVQIPCIERNAMGAVKAVNAASLALAEEGEHKVTLDMVIDTMREIGRNMNTMYKETSEGGLAVNVPEC